ncbi:hypothetical protein GHO42_20800 [Pseudomonas sp. FSL R10-0056]|uniref:hypothetical protein n=1 Tax=unclassified Pseudomonas TaxID=196821 RepID=UPI001295A974|nr:MULTISPECIES: hypothetical protein [unclassified Pseudomonas]MDN5391550.1 hypothetical protein [Pseudomonas sp.]MDN5453877.1 hypothetical protein [Pseudomonas sp.]MDN5457912.1 hypothetical protein [Pseudomonas sp.]MDN5496574.1 hypothetical protein [Pseudomonas sp.]MDN5671292.1 hypothetical protein [Pseudomonas sp.]
MNRRIGHRILIGLGVFLAVFVLAVSMSAALLRLFDSVQQWQQWRADYYWPLLAWRLLLYAVLTVGWLKLKARLCKLQRLYSRGRLLKIEILFVFLVLLIELSKVLFQNGGAQ